MSPQLACQLSALGIDASHGPSNAQAWSRLCLAIDLSYCSFDATSSRLVQSRDLASRELTALAESLALSAESLQLSEARLNSLLMLSADWLWEQDDQRRFTHLSGTLESVLGTPGSDLLGKTRPDGFRLTAERDTARRYCRSLRHRLPFRDITFGMRAPGSEMRYVRISGEPVFNDEGTFRGYRGVGREVTEVTLSALRVKELAQHDSLTGLPNRHTFMLELESRVHHAQLDGRTLAVCFIDLDCFKRVNDSLGHGAGDAVLKVLAGRLRQVLRTSDVVARLGGDEFAVLLEPGADAQSLRWVAQKLLAAIGLPVELDGELRRVTASIGISLFPGHGTDADSLLVAADAAMFAAKAHGKNHVCIYSAELAAQEAEDAALEAQLALAIDRDELLLHYQPKFDGASGRLAGVEALVRWQHPRHGLLMPDRFIRLAEQRGLAPALGRWVLRRAAGQIAEWQHDGLPAPRVAVNVSARQFTDDSLVDEVQQACLAFGIDPAQLELELTESVLMEEPDRAALVLARLRRLGVRLAIDDFGTGYSSLAYLKRLHAHVVKVDRSFVSGLPGDRDDLEIVKAIIALAHSLGMEVVAEGVETDAQRSLLSDLGCDGLQGFLLGRPVHPRLLDLRSTAPAAGTS